MDAQSFAALLCAFEFDKYFQHHHHDHFCFWTISVLLFAIMLLMELLLLMFTFVNQGLKFSNSCKAQDAFLED